MTVNQLKVKMWCTSGHGVLFRLMRKQGQWFVIDGDIWELQLLNGSQGHLGDPEDLLEIVLTFWEVDQSPGKKRIRNFKELADMSNRPVEFMEL